MRYPLALLSVALFAGQALSQENVALPRFPALSPDGKTLVFSYQGDLWTTPIDSTAAARRLTSHPAYEGRPIFSPDGKELAFVSNRFGRNEVFTMPATGGAARRLTNYGTLAGTTVQSWADGGKKVLVAMSRELSRRGAAFYLVNDSEKPGRPKPLLSITNTLGGQLSPDGTKLVFARGDRDLFRRGYKGTANSEIWTYTLATKEFKKLTTFEGADLWPLWLPDSKSIVYVSEQDGTYNLYKLSTEGGKPVPLTKYKGDGVRFPSVSADGTRVAYEVANRIEMLALSGKSEPTSVRLAVAADQKNNPIETLSFASGASEAAPSPDGEQIALIVRSDVYAIAKEGGRAQRLTETAAREGDLAWSGDGKTLFYVSRRDGNDEIYAVTSTDPDEAKLSRSLKRTTTRLTRTPEAKSGLSLSPDGKKLAFVLGHGKLMTIDLDGKNLKEVASAINLNSYSWAPDSKWVAYAAEDEEFNSDIVVVPTDGSQKPVNISKHPRNDGNPVWSPDGTKIFWIGERGNRETNLYFVYLKKDDDERTSEGWAKLKKKPAATEKPAAPTLSITVDAEGIEGRVRQLTALPGNEVGLTVAPVGEGRTTLSFTNGGELYLLDVVDGSAAPPQPRKLAGVTGARPAGWTKDGKTLYALAGDGNLLALAPTADAPRPVAYRGKQTFDRRELYKAVYEEAWQALNNEFYDPKFHGADWAAIREKYRPWAAAASDPQDFALVISLMMGHLNSSHIGYTPAADTSNGPLVPTGVLGTIWDESYTGPGLKIGKVIPGSPAERTESKLRVGEVVTAINGTTLESDTNPDELLADTVGERTLLSVTGTDGKAREVVILPAAPTAIANWLYDDWVETRKQLAHELSGGKLAYLHIKGMDAVSQDKFEAGLYAEAYGRDGLLIDVRDNGGGSTADYLLTMLTQPQHAFTIGRDGAPGYPIDRLPYYPWRKPAALLINQNSYSNAEIFAHAFRTIERGPIIGTQTFGAVISTGAASLLDGSAVRTPLRGWYTVKSGDNEEHNGARPDISVELSPADELAGRDPQLEAAVKKLLGTAKPTVYPAAKPAPLGTSAPK